MPVLKDKSNLADGLTGMAEVFQGYLIGEEVQRKRFLEERDYNFRQQSFTEGVRQFDDSLAEQVREFDTRLAFSAEQAALDREHQTFLQDDLQDFQAGESVKHRGFVSTEAEIDRELTREQNEKQRALQYWRARKGFDQQNEDRRIAWEAMKLANYDTYLGDADKYSEMPKSYIIGAGGKKYTPQELAGQIPLEIRAVSMGQGSDVLAEMSQQEAAEAMERIDNAEDPQAETQAVIDELIQKGVFKTEANVDREIGLKNLAIRNAGGEDAWMQMNPEQQQRMIQSTIHDLENMELARRRVENARLDYEVRKNQTKLGTDAYATDPFAGIAKANNQAFVYNNQWGVPVYSGAGDPNIGQVSYEMTRTMVDMLNVAETYAGDQERMKEEIARLENDLKDGHERMQNMMKGSDIDPRQGEQFYQAMLQIGKGEPFDPKPFYVDFSAGVKGAAPLTTKDGATKAGTRQVDVRAIELEGRMRAERAATTKSQRAVRKDVSKRRRHEDLLKGLETAAVSSEVNARIQRIAEEHPEMSSRELEELQQRLTEEALLSEGAKARKTFRAGGPW